MSVKDRFKRYLFQFAGLFPTRLPVGLTEYDQWCQRLLFTYWPDDSPPMAEDSFRFAIASMVLHLSMGQSRVPNRFFGKAIVKGASNEVASYVMQSLKAKQAEALKAVQEAEKLRKQLADTPTQTQAEATAPQATGEQKH